MNCQSCGKKLRAINADSDFKNWKRKYHQKCWNEKNIYYNLYLQTLKLPNCNPEVLKIYQQKSCLK